MLQLTERWLALGVIEEQSGQWLSQLECNKNNLENHMDKSMIAFDRGQGGCWSNHFGAL